MSWAEDHLRLRRVFLMKLSSGFLHGAIWIGMLGYSFHISRLLSGLMWNRIFFTIKSKVQIIYPTDIWACMQLRECFLLPIVTLLLLHFATLDFFDEAFITFFCCAFFTYHHHTAFTQICHFGFLCRSIYYIPLLHCFLHYLSFVFLRNLSTLSFTVYVHSFWSDLSLQMAIICYPCRLRVSNQYYPLPSLLSYKFTHLQAIQHILITPFLSYFILLL